MTAKEMKRAFVATVLLLALTLSAAPADARVEIIDGKFHFNSIRQEMVWGRSCFKLGNHLTYHWTGQGGDHWGLGSAEAWVRFHMEKEPFEYKGELIRPLGLPPGFVCRVFSENSGWDPNVEPDELKNDGKPDGGMFGSEPRDMGAWNVEQLRNSGRPVDVHPVMKNMLRWFFEMSVKHGMAFELTSIATLKHFDVPVGQQTHVVRQMNSEMRELQEEFPDALIIHDFINEWNAHSKWTLAEVNMLAVRGDRCKHPDGRTQVVSECSPGFEPEQWPGGPQIVDGGGGDRFLYDVGPEPGKYRAGIVHPSRHGPRGLRFDSVNGAEDNLYYPYDETQRDPEAVGEPEPRAIDWMSFPDSADLREVCVQDSRGMPCGANESMYYVEPEDRARAEGWYRRGGWTSNWGLYEGFLNHQLAACSVDVDGLDLFYVHDEKGAGSIVDWPRLYTRVDIWLRDVLVPTCFGGEPPPPPPTDDSGIQGQLPFVRYAYQSVFGRDPWLNVDERDDAQLGADRLDAYFMKQATLAVVNELYSACVEDSEQCDEYSAALQNYLAMPPGVSPGHYLHELAQSSEYKGTLP